MTAARERPRILVVDDEPQIRRFLRISLGSQGYDVTEAADAEAALKEVERLKPDLAILDLGLPGRDGRTVLDGIRRHSAELPVIILSVRADQDVKVDALDGGANDYVTKPFGLPELLARIRRLLRQPHPGAQQRPVFDDGHLRIDLEAHRATLDGAALRLTPKEFGLLGILLQHAGQVATQRHLLAELWGPTHVQHTHYLRIIVARLRQKLGADPTEPTYIHTEPGVGYRFGPRE